MDKKVVLVLVTFLPDRELLKKSLLSLIHQVRRVILISNQNDDFSEWGLDLIHINLKENVGIAAAQNLGIKLAMEDEVDLILTSDQDTIFPENYVSRMVDTFDNLLKKGVKIGAISPVFRDSMHGGKVHSMVRFGSFGLKKFFSDSGPQKVSHVISSGMFLDVKALKEIGLMKESFFIDWVDTEWCWRAESLGYSIYQNPEIVISHSLGMSSQDLVVFSVTFHSYIREYYKLRNAIFLLREVRGLQLGKIFYLVLFLLKNTLINTIKGIKNAHYFLAVKNSYWHGIKQVEGGFKF